MWQLVNVRDGVSDGQRIANVLLHTLCDDKDAKGTGATVVDGLFAIARAIDRLTEAVAKR